MHLKRLLIAAIALPLIYLYITGLPAEYFLFLLIIVSAAAQYEFYSMYNVKGLMKYIGMVFGALLISILYFKKALFFDLFIISFLIIAALRLFLKRNPAASLNNIASVMTAVVYIPMLLSYQMCLRGHSAEWVIFLYGCVWASDSAAYYVGKGIGKRKLYEEISPNKTVAGAVGSVIGGAIGAVIVKFALIYSISLPLTEAVVLGMIIGAVSIIGDLVESMFKRDAGVKDSSSIVPGHGGMLDKVDSMLFAGPVLYWAAVGLRVIK